MKRSNRKKPRARRKCSQCANRFAPYRDNQETCSASCRYKKYERKAQRVRLKVLPDNLSLHHYVQVSGEAQPRAYFLTLEDARAFAATLRRRQRKSTNPIKHRFTIGQTAIAPASKPSLNTSVAISTTTTKKTSGKSANTLSKLRQFS
jgi:hypothetical protein